MGDIQGYAAKTIRNLRDNCIAVEINLIRIINQRNAMSPRKTILCVDDDRVSRLVIKSFLEQDGSYNSVEAKSGYECLDYISQNNVDLILLDYHLGDMDGLSVCREIPAKSVNPNVPVIICSVVDKEDIQNCCNSQNVVEIIQKPYAFDKLQHSLREILEQ